MLRRDGEYIGSASKYSSPCKNEGKGKYKKLLYAELA